MQYTFSPVRFALFLFGFSIVAALLAGVARTLLGIDPGSGVLAIIPFFFAIGFEARRYGASLTAAPVSADWWALSLRTAVTGTVTYFVLLVLGSLVARGTAAMGQPGLWVEPLGMLVLLGMCAFVAGYFLIRAMALAAWKNRQ